MSKKYVITVAVVVAVLFAVGVWWRNSGREAAPRQVASDAPAPPTSYKEPSALPPSEPAAPSKTPARVSVSPPAAPPNTIVYSDSGYSPSSLVVPKGTTVTFRNDSSQQMWPASAKHPTHEVYPEAGGCIGSKFDACAGIEPGGRWTFEFNQIGTWKYHDHLNPSFSGTIVVTE